MSLAYISRAMTRWERLVILKEPFYRYFGDFGEVRRTAVTWLNNALLQHNADYYRRRGPIVHRKEKQDVSTVISHVNFT